MIDPFIWQDENFGKLPTKGKLLFIGLFSNADDYGKIRANDAYLKSTIFMYDNISLSKIHELMDEIGQTMKSVRLYEINENRYVMLKKWNDYQKQHKDRLIDSVLPDPSDVSDNVGQTPDNVRSSRLDKIRLSRGDKSMREEGISTEDGGVGKSLLKEKIKTLGLKSYDQSRNIKAS